MILLSVPAPGGPRADTIEFVGHITQSPAFYGTPPYLYPADPNVISVGSQFTGRLMWSMDSAEAQLTYYDDHGTRMQGGTVPVYWRIEMSGRTYESIPLTHAAYTATLGPAGNVPSNITLSIGESGRPGSGNLFADYFLGDAIGQSARYNTFQFSNEAAAAASWTVGFDDNHLGPGMGANLIGVIDWVGSREPHASPPSAGTPYAVPEPSVAALVGAGLLALAVAAGPRQRRRGRVNPLPDGRRDVWARPCAGSGKA
jgi:hypothetical protein